MMLCFVYYLPYEMDYCDDFACNSKTTCHNNFKSDIAT